MGLERGQIVNTNGLAPFSPSDGEHRVAATLKKTGTSLGFSRDLWLRVVSVLSILVAWLILTAVMGPMVIPGPADTWQFLLKEQHEGRLWFHIGMTLWRVIVSFVITMILGSLLGMLTGVSKTADRLLEAWVVLGLAIPRILLVVVAYLLIGLNDTAAIVALVLMLIPQVIVQIREGIRSIDTKLVEMARAFHRTRLQTWRQVVLPQLTPYLLGTARSTLDRKSVV